MKLVDFAANALFKVMATFAVRPRCVVQLHRGFRTIVLHFIMLSYLSRGVGRNFV